MAAEKKYTVLIVDDEPLTCDMLAGFLSLDGYHTVFAYDGPEALQRVKEYPPDVILLDIMMPEVDGYEVCRQLKADKRWQHIPIILVTALSGKEDLLEGFEIGADDFITKPVDRFELRARVRSMARTKKHYDDLQATLHMREDLTHLIVNDIRIPITAILGYTQILLTRESFAAVDTTEVRAIQNQAYRLDAFLNDMLILAKLESDQLILNRSRVDVGQLAQQVKECYHAIAVSKHIELNFDLSSPAQLVSLDENLFHRVLEILISNAIKSSPQGGTVTLHVEYPRQTTASAAEPQIRIKILDEGPGITVQDRDRIFDKLEVEKLKDRKKSPAAQQGFAFCKLVVDGHQGRISVESNQPTGSIFTIEI